MGGGQEIEARVDVRTLATLNHRLGGTCLTALYQILQGIDVIRLRVSPGWGQGHKGPVLG